MKRPVLFFVLANLFFSSFYLDVWHNANSTSRVLPVLSVVNQRTLKIDSFADQTIDKSIVNGHYYSDKAPLPSFIIMPFYAALKWSGLLKQDADFDSLSKPVFLLGSFICGSLPFVLICFLFFHYAGKYTSESRAALLVMVSLYGSFIFVFSGTFFTHVLSAALLLVSYIFIKQNKLFYSGLFLGITLLADYSVAFIIPIWALQIYLSQRNIKSVITFITGLAPLIILLLAYNKITTGAAFDILYNHPALEDFAKVDKPLGFSYPSLKALYGLTISPYRGLLVYCPILAIALVIYLKDKQKAKMEWKKNYLFLIAIGYLLLISSHEVWWGGWSYGPRQLMPLAVLLLFESVMYLSKKEWNKILFYFLAFAFVLFTWMVKSTVVYSVPTEVKYPFLDYFFQNTFGGLSNPNSVPTIEMGLPPWASSFIWLCFFGSTMAFLLSENKKQKA